MNATPPRVIAVLGTTASGKGALSRAAAVELNAEIVSLDSMKVYRGLDIGTAKPSAANRTAVPHHLIDVVDWWESFSAGRYVELADAVIGDIHARGKTALLVGGSILYFRCLYHGVLDGPAADEDFRRALRERAAAQGTEALHAELARIDPPAAARIHANDLRRIERALEVFHATGRPISSLQTQWEGSGLRRPDWQWTLVGLRWEREAASRRINARVKRMIADGLVEEARRVWDDPRPVSTQAAQAVGYKELFDHFAGRLSLDEAIEQIKINSRRLAKHQRTWLRRFGEMRWLDLTEQDDAAGALPRLRALIDAP